MMDVKDLPEDCKSWTVLGKQQFPEDQYVSTEHALIWRDTEDRFWIRDMGSTNGTFVIRKAEQRMIRVTGPHEVFPSDRIRIGRTIITVPEPTDLTIKTEVVPEGEE